MSFESSLRRLEEIVQSLEEDDLALDRALALFEEGVTRLREATAALSAAETTVKVLRERADGVFEVRDLNA
jgi:exodeoxyribonuclease VII small subunit